MREIKFRAWHRYNKKMYDVKEIQVSSDRKEVRKVIVFTGVHETNRALFFKRGFVELMQYTGLKDKNGKEIYEGDVVNITQNAGNFHAQIIWLEELAQYRLFATDGEDLLFDDFEWLKRSEKNEKILLEFEIIGNIYENPELIK